MVRLTSSQFKAATGVAGKCNAVLFVTIEVTPDGVISIHVGDPSQDYELISNGPQVGTLSVVGNARP